MYMKSGLRVCLESPASRRHLNSSVGNTPSCSVQAARSAQNLETWAACASTSAWVCGKKQRVIKKCAFCAWFHSTRLGGAAKRRRIRAAKGVFTLCFGVSRAYRRRTNLFRRCCAVGKLRHSLSWPRANRACRACHGLPVRDALAGDAAKSGSASVDASCVVRGSLRKNSHHPF